LAIKKYAELGFVDGITTNPSLIMKSGRDHKQVITEIGEIISGPISVEGIGLSAEEMVTEAQEFKKWIKNLVVKVPMTKEGLKAVKILSNEGIKTNVTLVFSASQALLAAKAGATYVSPFVGRLDDIGQDGMELVKKIMEIYNKYEYKTQVIVASIRSVKHIEQAGLYGAHVATIPPKVFEEMFEHELTKKGILKFLEDHKKSKG
jgi:transaldolase